MSNNVASPYGLRPAALFETSNTNVSSFFLNNAATNQSNAILVAGFITGDTNNSNLQFSLGVYTNGSGGYYKGAYQLSYANNNNTALSYTTSNPTNTVFPVTSFGLMRDDSTGGVWFELWFCNQGYNTAWRSKATATQRWGNIYPQNGGGAVNRINGSNTGTNGNFNGLGSIKFSMTTGNIKTGRVGLYKIGAKG